MTTIENNTNEEKRSLSFVEQLVEEDLAKGKNGGRIQTRFPPEPNRLSSHWSCESDLHGLWCSRKL